MGGKIVLILGGAGGIGAATAHALGANGALLVLADIDAQKLRAVVDAVGATGAAVEGHRVDVTKPAEITAVVDAVVDRFGRLDVLVNSAGIMLIRPVTEVDIAEWDVTVDLNLKGTLWGAAAVIPVFLRQNSGHIINLGSVHGLKVFPGGAVHSASKFAVRAFSEGLRAELAGHSIRVTTIMPGAVDSGIQHRTTGTDRGRMRQIYRNAVSPDAVARAIAFVIEQPADVSVNELVVRPTAQDI